jgi:hypothetical protein
VLTVGVALFLKLALMGFVFVFQIALEKLVVQMMDAEESVLEVWEVVYLELATQQEAVFLVAL